MSTPLIAPSKPKNARSKRALKKREPVPVEKGAKTAVFVRTSTASSTVKAALSDLAQLKKPDAINFSKPNQLRPFEDASSLQFWAQKNDASLFVVGAHSKKRPNALTWVRCFNGEVMEMLETSVTEAVDMASIKGPKTTPGAVPLFHFGAVEPHEGLWESHPTFAQLKSLMLDFYRGVEMDGVSLKGLERVISITIGDKGAEAAAEADTTASNANGGEEGPSAVALMRQLQREAEGASRAAERDTVEDKSLPPVHFRVYTVQLRRSGTPVPRVALEPHGPFLTFDLRRSQTPPAEMWKQAMKKAEKKDASKAKKRKNVDVDEMGDKVGRVHMEKQDLSSLQTRKFKALKRSRIEADEEAAALETGSGDDDDDGDDAGSDEE